MQHSLTSSPKPTTDIFCPDCGKLLFRIDNKTFGTVYAYCRRCRKQIKYEIRAYEPN